MIAGIPSRAAFLDCTASGMLTLSTIVVANLTGTRNGRWDMPDCHQTADIEQAQTHRQRDYDEFLREPLKTKAG
jgi:hypothetical protein